LNRSVSLIEARRGIASPVVALTFDDGPSEWTDPIADQLERHDGRGTFFAIGEAIDDATRRRTLRRLAERGHDLGNHTHTHPDLQTLDDDEIRDELLRTREVLEDVLGFTPRYWRAPFLRCDERVREAVGDLGGREVWFSSMGYDWEQPAEDTARRVLGDLEPGEIVVLHDGRPPNEPPERSWPTREGTVTAVGLILEEMTRRGLRSVTITELLESS
jgi:peptidoglycan-N-acetylglucosamine deacetylase